MIVFVHIPKTAGNTLSRLAGTAGRCCIVDAEKELTQAAATWDRNVPLPFTYLGGHFRLAFAEDAIAPFRIATPLVRATLLRRPLDRAFSLYLFLLRVRTAMPRHTEAIDGKDFAYFWDYARDNMLWHVTDAQCYLLCGARDAEAARKIVDERMTIVGTTEAFGTFYKNLRLLAPFANLPEDYSGHLGNVSPAGTSGADILVGRKPANWRDFVSAEALAKVERDNVADFALFEYLESRGGLVLNSENVRE